MNLRLDKVAPRLLRFFFRDNFYNDGSLPTASLAAVVRPHGPESRDWRGNLVVVAYSLTPYPTRLRICNGTVLLVAEFSRFRTWI